MPELPEVEMVRRTLLPLVVGKTIERVKVHWSKIIQHPDVATFCECLKGQTIHDIQRRGKFLLFQLDDVVLVSHLRMEGRYIYEKEDAPFDQHTHIFFTFTDQTELRYRDVRKFGTMHLFNKGEEFRVPPLSSIGVEPFDEQFTVAWLTDRLQRTKRTIKATLLDQTIVAGLGNIYVDEVLFRSSIHPERTATTLTIREIEALHEAIVQTIQEAIEKGGSTVRTYVNTQGKTGTFQTQLYVYGRANMPCRRCGNPISKTTVANRGTHYCKHCQT
ncbi:formamidopyrimidine-DNA glycosylase [Anoxybacillus flavithermus TNO-09.006]|uniref:DNA-formamidopyrimidine glycosylase n=1 Tax=Anoxybacillus TaxID=150247 RepID=UPI0002A70527|nr:DNA-formamidopyrimidine glycosylase [Anoxybacillus flavithermus]ELK22728.1 formamidopyrimidine-DNA glycosylase [Anoxybacillus flavithermus TNO-09.006]MBE2904984.1 DNA-formamidopyrimidine glycosylase [Anoxybacillus flavithermus]MBE2924078.1 DNA-formamidopyrimidine glycosylase [Anoxybacillus flavithermus]MBE2929624.1 DNA-formamidopyrimidine glycosylase [Anoxybacillus flavithermus]MBE2932003.1 DNA-formamidopyrimidine glycosylase [Anoxybacillus flavithermus]